MNKKGAFTLAEVLITLAIIGVVAAISIPSVISNTQQQEFKTGLRKAVSVLNSAITMNMAMEGETPYDNANLFGYLQRHMSVMKSTTDMSTWFVVESANGKYIVNSAFYTTDGMRYEFRNYKGVETSAAKGGVFRLYETGEPICIAGTSSRGLNVDDEKDVDINHCGGCGSLGMPNNPDGTTKPPCMIMVDVNGDRKPNPANINCRYTSCIKPYKYSDPLGLKLTDLFTIMITDREAIPFGVAAQRAMYQAQAKQQ